MSPDVTTRSPGAESCPAENLGVSRAPGPQGAGISGAPGGRRALTLCILASVSTMFLSTWSAFFCNCSMSSDSSLLETLQAERGEVSHQARTGSRQRPSHPGCPQPRAQSRSCPVSLRWSLAVPPGRCHQRLRVRQHLPRNQPLLWPSLRCFSWPCGQSTLILFSHLFY